MLAADRLIHRRSGDRGRNLDLDSTSINSVRIWLGSDRRVGLNVLFGVSSTYRVIYLTGQAHSAFFGCLKCTLTHHESR
jgi:hypothetical protein